MSSIAATDPFAVAAYQQDLIGTPLANAAAEGTSQLDVAQRAITIGEVVPIVFCRRVGLTGGVLISPGATEARFTNDAVTNAVTASYELVLGEGQLDAVQVRDTFQRSCRVGALQQTYNRRAGTWTRGNFITVVGSFTKPECPYYCGTGGSYSGLSTGSYVITAPDGDTRWDRQVHLFIRGGLYVTRLVDGVTGPSSNYVDLILWLLTNTSRVPADLIDTASLTTAAKFAEAMGFACDINLTDSRNLEDFIADTAKHFLLSRNKRGGKFGLRPMLPITATNEINTGRIVPVAVFNEYHIIPDSFNITYSTLADREPFCALMLWRQQPDNDIGLIRTTEVRYGGLAEAGPYEQYDLSAFATSELHAARIGTYNIAKRRYTDHTLTVSLRPTTKANALSRGDIIQIVLARVVSNGPAGEHNYLYQIEKISKTRTGKITLSLTHFPVDSLGRSLVALDVLGVTVRGTLLPTGLAATITCDVNSSSDTTAAADVGQAGTDYADDSLAGGDGFAGSSNSRAATYGGGGGQESAPDGPAPDPPDDGKDKQYGDSITKPPPGIPITGTIPQDTLDRLNNQAAQSSFQPINFDFGTQTYTVVVQFSGGSGNAYGNWNGTSGSTSGWTSSPETYTATGVTGRVFVGNGYYDGAAAWDAYFQIGIDYFFTGSGGRYRGNTRYTGGPVVNVPVPWGTPGVPNLGGFDPASHSPEQARIVSMTRTA